MKKQNNDMMKKILKNMLLTSLVFLPPIVILINHGEVKSWWEYVGLYIGLNILYSSIQIFFEINMKKEG